MIAKTWSRPLAGSELSVRCVCCKFNGWPDKADDLTDWIDVADAIPDTEESLQRQS